MPIENGSPPDADEVMNMTGFSLKDIAQNIFNQDYIGFDSKLNNTGSPDYINLDYSTFQTDDGDTGTTMLYSPIPDYYYSPGDVIDLTNDSSVDTNLWSKTGTGSLTEDTERLQLISTSDDPANQIIQLDQTSAPNLKSADNIIVTRAKFISAVQSGTVNNINQRLELNDGTNTVVLKSYTPTGISGTTIQDHVFFVDINTSAETADVYVDGVLDSSGIDLSTLTGSTWRLFYRETSSGNNTIHTIEVYNVYQITSSTSISYDYISVVETSSSTITNAILIANENNDSSTVVYSLSADNGSNYETVTPNEIHRFTNTGTQLRVKVTATSISEVYKLTEYLVKYNFY